MTHKGIKLSKAVHASCLANSRAAGSTHTMYDYTGFFFLPRLLRMCENIPEPVSMVTLHYKTVFFSYYCTIVIKRKREGV